MQPTTYIAPGGRWRRLGRAAAAKLGLSTPRAPFGVSRMVLLSSFTCSLLAGLAACSSADDELTRFIDETKHESGGRVEPLPEVKPYETFIYSAADLRSPFTPSGPGANGPGLRPDSKRNREFLEQFPLDTLRMVGTLRLGDRMYGLVQTKDGLVHRVTTGNYLGQADGKINEITAAKISLTEIVPDGVGGYIERPAGIALNQ
jgi:type IV pilus assembly protein PilP